MRYWLLGFWLVVAALNAAAAEGITVDGKPPAGYPAYLLVQNVPMGSGVPVAGVAHGYSKADYVRDGLYHVPGYLPYTPSADTPPQVVSLRCAARSTNWICDGYSVNPQIGRGENILIQPILVK